MKKHIISFFFFFSLILFIFPSFGLKQPSSKVELINVFFPAGSYANNTLENNATRVLIKEPKILNKNIDKTNNIIDINETFLIKVIKFGNNAYTSFNFTPYGLDKVNMKRIIVNGTTCNIGSECRIINVVDFNSTFNLGNLKIFVKNITLNTTLEIVVNYNYTLNLALNLPPIIQIDKNPLLQNESSISIRYNQTQINISAPFSQNITLNITLPDKNVKILSMHPSLTKIGNLYNATSISNLKQLWISFEANNIVTSKIKKYKQQEFPAYLNQNITWISTYIISYNSSFSNLNISNLTFNFTLWNESLIQELKIYQNGTLVSDSNFEIFLTTNSTLVNITINGEWGLTPNKILNITFVEKSLAAKLKENKPIFKDGIWKKNFTIIKKFSPAPYKLVLNFSFKPLLSPKLIFNGTEISEATFSNSTDFKIDLKDLVIFNDSVLKTVNYSVEGKRWINITSQLTDAHIIGAESSSLIGKLRYPEGLAINIPIKVEIIKKNEIVKTFNLTSNEKGEFSLKIPSLTFGNYLIKVMPKDEDGVFAIDLLKLIISPLPSIKTRISEFLSLNFSIFSINKFVKDSKVVLKSKNPELPIFQISLIPLKDMFAPKIKIKLFERLKNVPKVEKVVFKYIQIETENIDKNFISDINVDFKVEKVWIENNNIDKTKINLLRLEEDWKEMQTRLLKEDEEFVYYTAKLDSFSYFAIAGEKVILIEEEIKPKEEIPIERNVTNITLPREVKPTIEKVEEPKIEKVEEKGFEFWIFIPIITILALLFFSLIKLKIIKV